MGSLRVELLGQLLRDSRATASTGLAQYATFHDGSAKRYEVYARVFVEALILSSHKCLHQIGRKVVVGHQDAVFTVQVPRANDLPVSRKHLCGRTADGVLQFFDIGHVADKAKPDGCKSHSHKHDNTQKSLPKKADKCSSHCDETIFFCKFTIFLFNYRHNSKKYV